MSAIAVILAAGKGTRMRSEIPKPLVLLEGRPIVQYIINSFRESGFNDIVLVVGYQADLVRKTIGMELFYVDQSEQKGTAHAIMQVKNKINWKGKDVFIFVGDSPLITKETIKKLYQHHQESKSDCTFLTADFKMTLPYARVVKDKNGVLIKCVEEKNATEKELKITELLSSHFVFNGDRLFSHLDEIKPDVNNGEYYLTDIIGIFLNRGLKVTTLKINDYEELVGLNTPEDVAWAEEILNERIHAKN